MKRSTFITWDQLKVGAVIVAAIAIMTVAIIKLGSNAGLFAKRYELVAFMPNANGLQVGGGVTVAGQLVGVVRKIEFLPPTTDTTKHLKLTVGINEAVREQIRADSKAKLRTQGLLGDKIFDISPGSPKYNALTAGDTVAVTESLDYDQVIAQASGAVGDMVSLTHDLRAITGGIVRGDGTLGQLLTSRTLYDELTGTLNQTNQLLKRMQKPDGTFGRLVDDPTLYNHMLALTSSLDTLTRALNSRSGTFGKLVYDDSLYMHAIGVIGRADSLMKQLTTGNGFAARMINDQDMYDKLNKSITDLNAILADVRANPSKYFKGIVKIF
ncbi:MAG: MlaD family protein [Gemmatimonadota bacterium]|nr:MlaD family protein [Gemmatimonadota bacterium]